MRCVPIRPLVLAPQTKKVAASSQNAGDRLPRASAASGASAGGVLVAAPVAPYRVSPMSSGRSRMNTATMRNTTAAAAATSQVAARQPCDVMRLARSGRKINWPVALAADSAPTTRPRLASNQRVATMAASTIDVMPVPAPTSTPQSSIRCVSRAHLRAQRHRPGEQRERDQAAHGARPIDP